MARRTASFGDLYADFVAKHPGKASRTLAELRHRVVELEAGAPSRYGADTVDAKRRMVEAYVAGFRLASRCEMCGKELEDPTSVNRGVGPDCWQRLERASHELVAEPALSEEAF